MNFTFGILTYNHEDFIIETLESIKYQIINFGKDKYNRPIQISLIIIDDHSSDKTVELYKKWLEINKKFFTNEISIQSEENHGTVYNYKQLLKLINTIFFKIIAGDDLFSCDDVFEQLKENNYNSALSYIPVTLLTNEESDTWKLTLDTFLLNKNLYYSHKKRDNKYDIKQQEIGGYFNTPSFFITRNLINQKCFEYLNGLKLFEDDPTWHMVLKSNPNLSINFINKVKVLYRVHNKAVSNGSSSNSTYVTFLKDWKLIITRFIKEETNLFTKWILFLHLHDIKKLLKNKNNKFSLYKLITKVKYLNIDIATKKCYTNDYKHYLNDLINLNNEYYSLIKQNTAEFYKQFYGE